MIRCLITDDIDDWHPGTLRVVKISKTVGQSGSAMQQRRRRLFGQPGITVCRTGRHTLEEGKHTAYSRNTIERGDEMHLTGPRVGKASIDSARDQSPD